MQLAKALSFLSGLLNVIIYFFNVLTFKKAISAITALTDVLFIAPDSPPAITS